MEVASPFPSCRTCPRPSATGCPPTRRYTAGTSPQNNSMRFFIRFPLVGHILLLMDLNTTPEKDPAWERLSETTPRLKSVMIPAMQFEYPLPQACESSDPQSSGCGRCRSTPTCQTFTSSATTLRARRFRATKVRKLEVRPRGGGGGRRRAVITCGGIHRTTRGRRRSRRPARNEGRCSSLRGAAPERRRQRILECLAGAEIRYISQDDWPRREWR